MIDAGRRPGSVWQTHYVGSVGGQTLTAIAAFERLRNDPVAGSRVRIWPFEDITGADAVVVAECWPTWFDPDLSVHPVRDAAQVIGTARRLDELERTVELTPPPPVSADERSVVCDEEGWVLGV
jgi:precorrin-8X/cobalt-precorrin-8 methylmutase